MPRKKLHEDGEYRMTLRLSTELADRLKRMAEANKRSLNSEIDYALEKHVDFLAGKRDGHQERP